MFNKALRLACLLTGLSFAAWPALSPQLLPPAQAQTAVPTVAVLDLTAKGDASANEAGALTDRVRGLVVQSQLYQVMEREAVDKILREQGFQSTQTCEGQACIQLGSLLSVKQIVTGSLSRLGQAYTLNLRMVDTERGTILREEFLDCDCSLETLTRDKLPWLVAKLLGSPRPAAIPEQLQDDSRPVRVRRPWLVLGQTGLYHRFTLDAQFNFNEYFAVHGGGGYGFMQPFGFPSSPGFSNTWQPMAYGGVKAYFNPHDIAGFADLTFSTTNWLNAMLGAEYRHPVGLTFSASGGLGYSLPFQSATWIMGAGVGFSF